MKIERSNLVGIVGCALAVAAFSLPVAAAHHEAGEAAEHGKGRHESHGKMNKAMKEKKSEIQEDASERADEAREEADGMKDKAASRGAEMRERRDQRKAIQEDYKSNTDPSERRGKKPWWKFWGSDETEAPAE